jgi:hypothetical protein
MKLIGLTHKEIGHLGIVQSSRPNTWGSTLLHSNYGDFQVTLFGHTYRFDGFFMSENGYES